MSEAGKTPVPGARNGNGGLRVTLPGLATVLWAAIVLSVSVATTYVYATKDELAEHARIERETTSAIETKAAATAVHIDDHAKTLEKLERYIEAVDANQRTMMIESGIPQRRIARPKE